MLRVSYLHQDAISLSLQRKILTELEKCIDDVDLLVFSDFNYGCLPQTLVDQAITMARSHGVMLVADSQSSSQVGDVSRFQNMDVLTPTEIEARISVRNHEAGLVVLAEMIKKQAKSRNILLKLGEEGLLIHACPRKGDSRVTDIIGALNRASRDVAGAGDGNIWEAACLGALAAAVQVGRVGNTPIQSKEILYKLD
ncbi:MAG: PfkB family carbohydrate kinase [Mariprofundales bacterium]